MTVAAPQQSRKWCKLLVQESLYLEGRADRAGYILVHRRGFDHEHSCCIPRTSGGTPLAPREGTATTPAIDHAPLCLLRRPADARLARIGASPARWRRDPLLPQRCAGGGRASVR